MPIWISDATTYRFVGPVWAILCFVITVLHSDVPKSIYGYVSCYSFLLEDVGIRLRL